MYVREKHKLLVFDLYCYREVQEGNDYIIMYMVAMVTIFILKGRCTMIYIVTGTPPNCYYQYMNMVE